MGIERYGGGGEGMWGKSGKVHCGGGDVGVLEKG